MTKFTKMKWSKVEQNDDDGSTDPLTQAQIAEIYGAGSRILSTYHRSKPTVMQSATSSTSSVATNAGSTAALIKLSSSKKSKTVAHQKNRQYAYQKHNLYNKNAAAGKMIVGTRKEMNLLLASPTVPDMLSDSEDTYKRSSDSDEGIPTLNSTVIRIKDRKKAVVYKRAIKNQVLASLTVSLGSMIVGFASAYTSPALPSMNQIGSRVSPTEEEASWIGSLMPLSALFGGMAGGPLIESLGRRTTILSTGLPFVLSFLLIALANGVPMILAGRCIAGFCVGIASLALPVYLGETVQPEVRGTLGLLPTFLGNIGILACFVAGTFLNWYKLAFMGACIPIPFIICMFLIPETPRWYIGRNKQKQARKALQWLRGDDADISREFAEIEKMNNDGNEGDDESSTGCSEVFKAMYMRPLLISIGLMFFQQMSGINAVIFYTVKIFKDAGSTIDENYCTIIVGVVNLLSTLIATAFIDRLGRKILLYISSTAMFITLATLGTFFYYKSLGYDVSTLGWLPLLSFVIYVIGFSIGFGSIPWLMMGEILPAKIRGSAASLATAFNWTCTFVVTKTFNDMTALLGTHGAFWLFGVICLIGLFFVIIFVPETQGKSLEDIERNLTGGGGGSSSEGGPRVKVPVRNVRRMSSIANLKPLPIGV
nr:trehalose transporter 1 [Bactericera cockerelli]